MASPELPQDGLLLRIPVNNKRKGDQGQYPAQNDIPRPNQLLWRTNCKPTVNVKYVNHTFFLNDKKSGKEVNGPANAALMMSDDGGHHHGGDGGGVGHGRGRHRGGDNIAVVYVQRGGRLRGRGHRGAGKGGGKNIFVLMN